MSFFSRIRIKIHYPLYWPFRDFWKSWFKLTMWWDHVQLKIKKCYLEKVLVKTVKLFGKSFLYIKNKNGLKTDPCDMLAVISVHDENWPFKNYSWQLFRKFIKRQQLASYVLLLYLLLKSIVPPSQKLLMCSEILLLLLNHSWKK